MPSSRRATAWEGATPQLVPGARRIDRLEALAKDLSLGDGAVLKTNFVDRKQVECLVDRAVEKHGRIDVLISNAGPMPQSLLANLKVDE